VFAHVNRIDVEFSMQQIYVLMTLTRNILDCDQSNVLLAHLFDSPRGVSYRWSMVTRRLSGTVIEIFSHEDNAVTTSTFGVT